MKTERFEMTLSPEDKARFKRNAEKRKMSLASYILEMAKLGEARK